MSTDQILLNAVRTGKVEAVRAILNMGSIQLNTPDGGPILPLGMACFMGFEDIVRELITRGAKANLPDNTVPTSPLSMAIRGKRPGVVKVLIEMGVAVPPNVATGLSDADLAIAREMAKQRAAGATPVVEEIDVIGCVGTDTSVLEADVIRAARKMNADKQTHKS